MPKRVIRGDEYCESEAVERLAGEGANVLYDRLLFKADDFGLMPTDPVLIKSRCFPRRDGLTLEQITRWLREIEDAKLIDLYSVDGKQYLSLRKYGQRIQSLPKLPLPSWLTVVWSEDGKKPVSVKDSRESTVDHGGSPLRASRAQTNANANTKSNAEAKANAKTGIPDAPPPPLVNAPVVASTQKADPTSTEFECMETWLQQFAESVTGRPWQKPDRRIVVRALKACGEAPLADASSPNSVRNYLRLASSRKRPEMRSYALVVRMLADEFGGER